MKLLTHSEIQCTAAGSFVGVVVYGTIGFWVGGFTGFCMGGLPAIPGAVLGMTLGAYLGTDHQPTVVYIQQHPELTNK